MSKLRRLYTRYQRATQLVTHDEPIVACQDGTEAIRVLFHYPSYHQAPDGCSI